MARRRYGPKPSFWLSVAGISLLTPFTFNYVVDRWGNQLPDGLTTFNNYLTRRNG